MAGWGPYAYFRAVEEIRSNPRPLDGMNQQLLAVNNTVVDHNLDSAVDAMEAGRK